MDGGQAIVNWWGKLIGAAAGMALGGPVLAVAGAAIGHQVDRRRLPAASPGAAANRRLQLAFMDATFSVMGHLCKSDGRVSEAEIAMANKVMQRMALNPTQRRRAMEQFRAGKAPSFVLGDALTGLRADCGKAPMLLHMFVDVQLSAALADGDLTPQEDTTLRFICVRLGIPAPIYEQALAAARIEAGLRSGAASSRGHSTAPTREDDYAVLGVSANATDAEIKQAYRRLISQHHPDKLAAEGVSAEMLRLANEKTLRVRQAYERIQSMRGAA